MDRDERTEPATPRRRGEARARGRVARSHDLAAATLMLAGFVSMHFLATRIWFFMLGVVRNGLSPEAPWDIGETLPFATSIARAAAGVLWPLLALISLAVMVALFAQVGPLLTFHPVTPSFGKLNPLAGLQRLFSLSSVVSATMNMVKLIAVGLVGYVAMAGASSSILHAFQLDAVNVLRLGAKLTFRLGVSLAAAFFVLSLLDYAWQWFQHERNLRMTKEEVKDELRSMEGDPAIKLRRRKLQMQFAMQRLRRDVPKADVVVTNPTHYSVALQYDGAEMPAPKVVAKGADEVALRIRQIARENGIPIVERKPLARALYDAVDVNQYIPERFYQAIAEILAYVYELTGKSTAVR